jgi:uncharacterized phage protein (TIGR01671 family)
MAREILFKAKRKDNGEWVEGSLLVDEAGNCYIGVYIYPRQETDIVVGGRTNGKTHRRFHGIGFTQVDSNTICQYTGLTDKNGNKIWENDVVFVTDDEGRSGQVDTGVGEIDFLEGFWYISGNVQNSLYDINNCFLIEVIGNIFDDKLEDSTNGC